MEPGQISDLVKTQYGYHIIKLVDKKAATTRPLAEVRQQIQRPALVRARAGAGGRSRADAREGRSKAPGDLDRVAKAKGLPVQESGFFARDEPILGLGPSPEAASRAFDMKQGEVAGPLRSSRGFVFETLLAKQDPYIPKLDEVKERVRDEVVKQKARELSRQKAAELAAKLKTAPDFEKAAKAAGFEAKTTEIDHTRLADSRSGRRPGRRRRGVQTAGRRRQRRHSDGQRDRRDQSGRQAGSLTCGLDRRQGRFREELLTDRRNRFFSAYMVKAKQKMKIEVNREGCSEHSDRNRLGHEDLLFVGLSSHRKNVNGISARASPRRNMVSGPRMVRKASSSRRRQVRLQPLAHRCRFVLRR